VNTEICGKVSAKILTKSYVNEQEIADKEEQLNTCLARKRKKKRMTN